MVWQCCWKNASKTKGWLHTNFKPTLLLRRIKSQPPWTITTDHGITLKVLPGNVAQKWLGCMFTVLCVRMCDLPIQPEGSFQYAVTKHLSGADNAASNSLSSERYRRISRGINFGRPEGSHFSLSCLHYFDAVVSSAPCFAGRHRTMYKEHVHTLDLHFPKFCRSVGPNFVVRRIGNWRLALANFPFITGLTQTILQWEPVGQRRLRQPKHRWENKLEMNCLYQGLGQCEDIAHHYDLREHAANEHARFFFSRPFESSRP